VGFELTPISDTECRLIIRLTVNGESETIERKMTNDNNEGWRLDKLIHK
jgi:hypothetical protein